MDLGDWFISKQSNTARGAEREFPIHCPARGCGLQLLGGLIEGALFLREVGVAVNVDVIASVEGGGSRAPSAAIGCAGRCARPGGVLAGVHVAGSGSSTARAGD